MSSLLIMINSRLNLPRYPEHLIEENFDHKVSSRHVEISSHCNSHNRMCHTELCLRFVRTLILHDRTRQLLEKIFAMIKI
jgi:hypothetical protein